MKEKLINWLNLALMADLFLVLLSFVWLAIAVLGQTAHISLGLELWYQLWAVVFQPAIGILMAGAILSGLASWIAKRLSST
ncbi:MAG: hypothetical protein F6K19_42015 [Cyanothece sp. SIO1E1]|nr:hypothetical protein [Cyanothece sp. SIO1E1]